MKGLTAWILQMNLSKSIIGLKIVVMVANMMD